MAQAQRFDHRVHIRDPKTGRVVRTQPYRMISVNRVQYYLRDGVFYNGAGEVIDDKDVPAEAKAQRKEKK